MPLNIPVLILQLVDAELQRVDRLSEVVETSVNEELAELRALAGDEDEGIEFYADEAYELSDLSALFTQLSVIALYAVVEIRTKSLLARPAGSPAIRKMFKFAEMKGVFEKASGQRLERMPHYTAIDELRCLNNAIKHSGVVGAELASFPGWKRGDMIGDVRPAVTRIRPIIRPFLSAVAAALG